MGTVSTPSPVTLTISLQIGPADRRAVGQRVRHRRRRADERAHRADPAPRRVGIQSGRRGPRRPPRPLGCPPDARRTQRYSRPSTRVGLRGHGGAWFPVGTKWRAVAGRRAVASRWWWPTGPRASRPAARTASCSTAPPTSCSTVRRWRPPPSGASRVVVHVHRRPGGRRRAGPDRAGRPRASTAAPSRSWWPPTGSWPARSRPPSTPSTAASRGSRPSSGIRSVRDQGVAGRPTLVQNVETLAHVGPDRPLRARVVPQRRDPRVAGHRAHHRHRPVGRPADRRGAARDHARPRPRHRPRPGSRRSRPSCSAATGVAGSRRPRPCRCPTPRRRPAATGRPSAPAWSSSCRPGCARSPRRPGWSATWRARAPASAARASTGSTSWPPQLEHLAYRPRSLQGGVAALPTLCGLVEGRGACRHPDGVARFVRTAVDVFGDHAALHLSRGPCQTTRPFLPVPSDRRRSAR